MEPENGGPHMELTSKQSCAIFYYKEEYEWAIRRFTENGVRLHLMMS